MEFRGGMRSAARVGLLMMMLFTLALPAGASADSTSAQVSTTQLDFGDVPVGYASPSRSVTVTAIGESPMEITSLAFFYADGYAVTSESCTQQAIPVGSSCTVNLAFNPVETGPVTAALGIDDASGGYNEVALTGKGVEPSRKIAVAPASLDFGSVQMGSNANSPQVVTVQSTGNIPLTVSGVTITGAGAGQFSASTAACTSSPVGPESSCQIEVRASRTVLGNHLATLEVSSDASATPSTVSLSSSVVAPAGEAMLSMKLKAPKKVRAGTALVFTVSVSNSGTAASKPFTLRASGPKKLTKKVSPAKYDGLAPGESVDRKIRIPVKKSARGKFRAVVTLSAADETTLTAKSKPISITRRR